MSSIHERRMRFLLWVLLALMALLIGVQRFQGQSVAGGEFIITFREKANLQAARGRRAVIAELKRAHGRQAKAALMLETGGAQFRRHFSTNAISVRGASADLLRQIARLPEVESIEAAGVYEIHETVQPGIARISAPEVWFQYTRGEGVTVATIDTGVDWQHPDLAGNYRGRFGSHSGNWHDPTGVCGAFPCDNNSHGTHVTGIIAGANGIGAAPGAEWIACKGCEGSSCTAGSLLACGDWILDPRGDGSGDGAPDVVNNSWGGGTGDLWYLDTVRAWSAAGIVPVFSAGNAGTLGCGSVRSPGDYPEVVTVGAFSVSDGQIAGFSSMGPSAIGGATKPDIALPGVAILSSVPGGGRATKSGTSMSAPHATGLIALLISREPGLTVGQVKSRLQQTAEFMPITDPCGGQDWPNNTWGHGIGNALRAVEGESAPPPPPNELPVITITQPQQGDVLTCVPQSGVYYLRFIYSGQAIDPEDGDVSASMRWQAGWGVTYFGPSSSTSWKCPATLAPGEYQVTVRATDSRGAAATKAFSVMVENPTYEPPPEPEPPPPTTLLPQPVISSATRSGGNVVIRWTDNASNEDRWEVWESRKSRGWTELAKVATLAANSATATVQYAGFSRYVIRSGAGSATSLFSEFAQVK